MIPAFDPRGVLPEGTHQSDWPAFKERFGWNLRRQRLTLAVLEVAHLMRHHGARRLWIDGSFVSAKPEPGDVDLLYSLNELDEDALLDAEPVLEDFSDGRKAQKARFGGVECWPIEFTEASTGRAMLEFFAFDRDDQPKGLIELDLSQLPQE